MDRRTHLRFKRVGLRVLWSVGTPLVVLLLVRLVWGFEAEHRLAAVRAEISGKGYRLEAAAYAKRPIADEDNAVIPLQTAVRKLQIQERGRRMGGDERWWALAPLRFRFLTDAEWEQARSNVAANDEVLRQLAEAARRRDAVWNQSLEEMLERSDHMWGSYHLAAFLATAAGLAHRDGADDVAVQRVEQMLQVAHWIEQEPSMQAHADATWVRMIAAATAEQVERDMVIGNEKGNATPVAVRHLCAMLLDDAGFVKHFATASEYQLVKTNALLAPGETLDGWWIRPMAMDDLALRLERDADFISAAAATQFDPTRLYLRGKRNESYLSKVRALIPTQSFDPGTAVRFHLRVLADQRAMAVLLASRLYAADHNVLPDALEKLIGPYLERTVLDPYATETAALHFRLDGDGVTVWSVGENGVDDGGVAMRRLFGGRFSQPDLVYGAGWWNAPVATMP